MFFNINQYPSLAESCKDFNATTSCPSPIDICCKSKWIPYIMKCFNSNSPQYICFFQFYFERIRLFHSLDHYQKLLIIKSVPYMMILNICLKISISQCLTIVNLKQNWKYVVLICIIKVPVSCKTHEHIAEYNLSGRIAWIINNFWNSVGLICVGKCISQLLDSMKLFHKTSSCSCNVLQNSGNAP